MKMTALLIDGGHLRQVARRANKPHQDARFIMAVAESAILPQKEEVFRVLYYDCPPFEGEVDKPISGDTRTFRGTEDNWMQELSEYNYFALRLGKLAFRGWRLKREF